MLVQMFDVEAIGEQLPAIQDEENNWYFSARETVLFAEITDALNATKWVKNNIPPKWYLEIKIPGKKGRPALYLTKPGFYYAVCQGKSLKAMSFRDWVFEDLLVKLESQGIYVMQQNGESLADYEERNAKLTEFNQKLLEEKAELAEQLTKATNELKYWNIEFGEPRKPNLQNMRYQQVYSELQDMCPRPIWVAAHKKVVRMIPELTSVIPQSMLK